ncbi:MAG: prephenate/arogenate dehydrogenase family protein [Paracoccaceae bacterium]
MTEFAGQPLAQPYKKVALIGLGLIASSLFWAMRRAGMDATVSGYARSQSTRDTARRLGLCDLVCDSAIDAVKDADLVILCVPVGVMGAVAADIAPHLAAGATVTDVGSVKKSVIAHVAPHIPAGVDFVPAHPMAGTEHSGPDSGFASLFDNRWCLIVPGEAREVAVTRLESFWQALGANTERMEVEHHDQVCAVVSHIPHLIAYTMVGVADDLSRVSDQEVIKFSAAGFRDFTRIAASDPTMWRDVFLENKEATLEILGRFTEELFVLQRAIRSGDGDHLFDYFTRTRAIRRGIIEAGQDTDAPDFGRGKSK